MPQPDSKSTVWISLLCRLLLLGAAVCLQSAQLRADDSGWSPALPGWTYEFPRDHHQHLAFKTEWLYFTGNLATASGRRFGYELTFFRQGIRPPDARGNSKSTLLVNDLPFAHFCISDPEGRRFLFQQKLSRGAFAKAGFDQADTLAWIDRWSVKMTPTGVFQLSATNAAASLQLELQNAKPDWTIHGLDGVSQKAAGAGHASHYYSGPRLHTTGTLTLGSQRFEVTGESWFDHEWATNQLTPEQAGWNWFGLQFDDGSELMLYQMRLRNGGIDPASSGTYIDAGGTTRHLVRDDYVLTPLDYWTSKTTGARYPIQWSLSIPSLNLKATIQTPLSDQELSFPSIVYWEGMVDLQGTRSSHPLRGSGYMELTGYAAALSGLTQ